MVQMVRSFAAGILFLAWGAWASEPVRIDPSGVRNFHQVDDHVYRGGQPTPAGFKNLARIGIKTIIDLRGGDQRKDEQKIVEKAGMHYVHVPLFGLRAPTDQQVATVFAVLNDPSAWPVFVHCRRGADRTGTIIACYRIAHDHWANQKALEEARMHGMSWIEHAMMRYVLQFQAPASPDKPALSQIAKPMFAAQ